MKNISVKQLELITAQINTMLSGMGLCLDSDESADLDTALTGFLEEKCGVAIEGDKPTGTLQHWYNDTIQFPRLIAEINANFRLNGEELNDLLESMSITTTELDELFNRAEQTYQAFKPNSLQSLNSKCNSFCIKPRTETGSTFNGIVDNNTQTGLAIYIEGYSDHLSDDDNGVPVYLTETDDGLSVVIYSDINNENPTHIIPLQGAKIEARSSK